MNKPIRVGLVIALVSTLALFALATPVRAYFCTRTDDYTVAQGTSSAWSGRATYVGGTGWENNPGVDPVNTQISFDDLTSWDLVSVTVYATAGTTLELAIYDGGTYQDDHVYGFTSGVSQSYPYAFVGPSRLFIGINQPGTIYKVTIVQNCAATPTPTFTPTPTAAPAGAIPAIDTYAPCPLLGDENATFVDGARWNFHPTAFGEVSPPDADISGGYVDQLLTLSRYNKYIVTLKYKQTTAASGTAIIYSLGKTAGVTVPLTATTAEQTYTAPASNYEPTTLGSADSFDFFIGMASNSMGNAIKLTYACISDENSDVSIGAGAKALATTCQSCTYVPGDINGLGDIINNIVKLLQWLWCGFSQIWDCSVRPFFADVLAIIAIIIAAIAFIRQWWSIILSNGNEWIGLVLPILAHWVAGFIINVIQALLNAAATLGRSLGLGGLFDFIANLIQNGPAILNLITGWVQTAIQQILNVLAAIPTIFNALISGYNHTATSTGATAPVCTDSSNILYGPCLGMYVLDNTIFNGPTFYAIPLALGLVAFNTILWAASQIRNALTR